MHPMKSLAIAAALAWCGTAQAWADPQDYRLGPEDQLQIRVYDLRSGTGEAYQWLAFNGDFTVGASGKVSLPLIGELQASNTTTSDLAKAIADKLQAKVGLAAKPDAAVQVTKYRSFYVLGSVDRPGGYEYHPGLTVLQAVSLAGGLSRIPGESLLSFAREALVSRGDLRVLDTDRLDLMARQARLDAQIGGADKIVFPAELLDRAGEAQVARIIKQEQQQFDNQRESLRADEEVLQKSKELLQQEIGSLQAKDATLAHQLEINKRELDQVSSLVAKGLMVLPRQLEIQRTTAQFESDRLDVQVAGLRAHQSISKIDQDILEMSSKQQTAALQEAADVRNRLAQTLQRIVTDRNLIFQSEVSAPAAISSDKLGTVAPSYSLIRQIDGRSESRVVSEGDFLQPGDVIRVEPSLSKTTAMPASATDTRPSSPVRF